VIDDSICIVTDRQTDRNQRYVDASFASAQDDSVIYANDNDNDKEKITTKSTLEEEAASSGFSVCYAVTS